MKWIEPQTISSWLMICTEAFSQDLFPNAYTKFKMIGFCFYFLPTVSFIMSLMIAVGDGGYACYKAKKLNSKDRMLLLFALYWLFTCFIKCSIRFSTLSFFDFDRDNNPLLRFGKPPTSRSAADLSSIKSEQCLQHLADDDSKCKIN